MFDSHGPVAGPADARFSPPGPGESAVRGEARQRDPSLPVHRDREPGLVRQTRGEGTEMFRAPVVEEEVFRMTHGQNTRHMTQDVG